MAASLPEGLRVHAMSVLLLTVWCVVLTCHQARIAWDWSQLRATDRWRGFVASVVLVAFGAALGGFALGQAFAHAGVWALEGR
jgi:hypothetical protein